MLDAKNISVDYDERRVLNDVSFSVKPGERLCILGPNGSGKTTLLLAATGLLPFEGSVQICGRNLYSMSRKEIAKKVALMSQMTDMYFPYTVYETVLMGRYAASKGLFASNTPKDREVTLSAMKKTGILDLKDRNITQLSGGQLQRVFLARTFAQDPDIILLDEPTNHLDLKYKVELIETLKAWATKKDKAVIGVLHDVNLALSFADRILLLDDGHVKAYAPAKEFPMEQLSKAYGIDVPAYMRKTLKYWET